jgi:hypothetical protein
VRSWEGEKVGGLEEHGAKGIAGKEIWTTWERIRNRLTAHGSRPSAHGETVRRREDREVGRRKRKKVRSWEGEKVGGLEEHGAKGIAGKEIWTTWEKIEVGSGKFLKSEKNCRSGVMVSGVL